MVFISHGSRAHRSYDRGTVVDCTRKLPVLHSVYQRLLPLHDLPPLMRYAHNDHQHVRFLDVVL
jgi:hypothetical protein